MADKITAKPLKPGDTIEVGDYIKSKSCAAQTQEEGRELARVAKVEYLTKLRKGRIRVLSHQRLSTGNECPNTLECG